MCSFSAGKDVSSDVNKSTAIYLFELLREPSFVSKNELSKIAETFGPCDRNLVDDAHKLTQVLISNIPEDELNKKIQSSTQHDNKPAFGEGIKFFYPEPREFEADLTLFDTEVEKEKPQFSLKVSTEQSQAVAVKVPQENREDWVTKTNVKQHGDINWLKERCDFYFGNAGENVNSGDMCSVLFDLLSSPRGNSEMQNELFELLGFDRFEFIQELLTNREKIITGGNVKDATTVNGSKGWSKVPSSLISDWWLDATANFFCVYPGHLTSAKNSSTKPNYGCQVTIQVRCEV